MANGIIQVEPLFFKSYFSEEEKATNQLASFASMLNQVYSF